MNLSFLLKKPLLFHIRIIWSYNFQDVTMSKHLLWSCCTLKQGSFPKILQTHVFSVTPVFTSHKPQWLKLHKQHLASKAVITKIIAEEGLHLRRKSASWAWGICWGQLILHIKCLILLSLDSYFFLIIIWHFSHLIVLRVTSLVVVNHGSVKACFSLQQQLSAALWDVIGKLQC